LERIAGILGTYLYKDSNGQRQKTDLYLTCETQIGATDFIYKITNKGTSASTAITVGNTTYIVDLKEDL
jgi:hypothetical protein